MGSIYGNDSSHPELLEFNIKLHITAPNTEKSISIHLKSDALNYSCCDSNNIAQWAFGAGRRTSDIAF